MCSIRNLTKLFAEREIVKDGSNNGAFVELQKARGCFVRVTPIAKGEYEISFNGKPIHTSKDVTDVGKWLMSLRIISSL